ncbi:MAG: hypothetical protein ACYTFO_07125, partial [Planctomycetota bacterium]
EDDLTYDIYAGAADRFNAALREHFLAGTQRERFPQSDDLLLLAGECLHAEIRNPTPPVWDDAGDGSLFD